MKDRITVEVQRSNVSYFDLNTVWFAEAETSSNIGWTTPYHCLDVTTHIAYQLYAAGFGGLNKYNGRGRTPLMMRCRSSVHTAAGVFDASQEFDKDLTLIRWYLEHGADLHQSFGNTDSSASHLVAWNIAHAMHAALDHIETCDSNESMKFMLQGLSESATKLFEKIITDTCCDACSCRCSLEGCRALTIFLKYFAFNPRARIALRAQNRTTLVDVLEEAVPSKSPAWHQISKDVIRFLVFEELGLTHTCCLRGYRTTRWLSWHVHDIEKSDVRPVTGIDAIGIFEEEQELHELLEDLIEKSMRAVENSNLSLSVFLKAYWPSLMITAQEKKLTPENLRAIHELGVNLYEE